MVRTRPKRDGYAIRRILPISGARENPWKCPYRDLTQVPLAEKAKAFRVQSWRGNSAN